MPGTSCSPSLSVPSRQRDWTREYTFGRDKHGTAGKQLSKLLAKPDPAALENGVAGKSAALQSLAALERVLFDQG